VEVTGYSNDGGIDVVLHNGAGELIGVQVKRYNRRVGVSYIREFTGALVLGGYTRGIFVTTSDFQAGAQKVASISADKGFPIELQNADRFFGALHIAQISSIRDVFDLKPWQS
jgi:restriction system protein